MLVRRQLCAAGFSGVQLFDPDRLAVTTFELPEESQEEVYQVSRKGYRISYQSK